MTVLSNPEKVLRKAVIGLKKLQKIEANQKEFDTVFNKIEQDHC